MMSDYMSDYIVMMVQVLTPYGAPLQSLSNFRLIYFCFMEPIAASLSQIRGRTRFLQKRNMS